MGGKSSSEQTAQQTQAPWGPVIPGLTNLAGKVGGLVNNAGLNPIQSGAIDTLEKNAGQGNPWASQISDLAGGLLGGGPDRTGIVNDAYTKYQQQLDPYASGANLDPMSNPGMRGVLDTIRGDVGNSVNSMFAGAGRDLSGKHVQALSRGIAQGEATPLFNQYNQNVQNQLGAAGSLYGAGGGTAGLLSNLDQTKIGNQVAGVGMTGEALNAKNYGANSMLELEAQRWGIPLQQYAQLAGILGPLGQLGGTSSGTQGGTQQMSGAQQFGLIAGGLGKLFSDRRLKNDIEQVGALYDGTPVYRFRYVKDQAMRIGLMADDVEKYAPDAVSEIEGFKAVDYAMATARAAGMGAR